jgi:hypothetical protein
MLLKHKQSGKERLINNPTMLEHYLSNGWEPAEGHAKPEPKASKPKAKKAEPIVEDTPTEEVEDTTPITESKEN